MTLVAEAMWRILLAAAMALGAASAGATEGTVSPPQQSAPRHFALTLVTAADPVPDLERYQRDLPEWVVYQTATNVAGRQIHVVRLGFFTDVAQAYAVRRRLLQRYPDIWTAAVSQREYDAAMAGRPAGLAPFPVEPLPEGGAEIGLGPAVAAPPVARRANILAVELSSHRDPPAIDVEQLPERYRGYHLYVTTEPDADATRYRLRLGFFANRDEAEVARQELARSFPRARVVAVSAREPLQAPSVAAQQASRPAAAPASTAAGATAAADTAVPAAPGAGTTVPSATTPTAVAPAVPAPAVASAGDPVAEELLARARESLTAGNNAAALESLEQLLRLPPNAASQEAQELVGVARERNGEIGRARTEYELYLKLYPDGEGADRVRQRLASLATTTASGTAGAATSRARPAQTLTYGGLSQYYYYGASKIESRPFDINANPLDQTTLSLTDQSAIISSLDYTTRWRSERFDNRFVFRDTYTANFTDLPDDNRLNAAYYDLKDKQLDYGARVGRQPGNTAGILLPFDGARVNYGFAAQWRGNLQAGKLVDYYTHYDKRFAGASLDMGTFAERWTASAYLLQQQVDGISDREAVGAELRYFDARRSLLALIDYDTSYSVVNSAVLQGTWQTAGGATYNLLLDRRKSPPIQTTNALIGETATTIGELLNTLSEEEIRRYAEARTATASVYQIGAAYPVNTKWQVGGDVQLTNISGTESIGTVPGNPGTGNQFTYALQATGTGIFATRDSATLRASYIDAQSFDGQALSVFSRTLVGERWALDVSLVYYRQQDNLGVDLTRLTPVVKLGYNWKPNLVFELELGLERTETSSAFAEESTNRHFGSLGYRWDF